ncbi:MAG TPA: hypothetical protein VG709_07310, partial [Actinomycetota bacterium]|nr:hypothetical protein [Actinomycetota bacterium]
MRRYEVLFVALSVVLVAPNGAAASCAPVTPAAAFKRADLVFLGSASDSVETGFTDFDVETYFKGVGPERVHVLTGQPQENVAGSGDVHPGTGSRWVVYAFTDPEWGLRIDSCASHAIRGAEVPPARGIGAPA